jgi:S1-C subfamily serine protease
VKHVAIAFSLVAFCLNLLLAGVVAAQSAPPRKDIPAIAKAANGVIVSIITSDKDGHPVAQGTGFLVSKDGRIVTNYHVIKGASSAIVKLPDGAFYDVDGVVAFDKARDLAVIKAHGQNFRVVTLGNSDRVQVGEEIVAIGSPLSLESTVSSGIVSGIRTIKEEGGKFLQVTAPISPGSSGGPLFNMAGEVVGITTLYLKGGENLNFAIPVNDAKLLLSADSKAEKAAETWRNRESAKAFVDNLGGNDRITVYRRVDSETGSIEETYILYKPPAEPEPIFKSGDGAAVRQAIESGLLEPSGETTYKKRKTVP